MKFAKERVTVAVERMVPGLQETDFRKSGVEKASEDAGLAQLLIVAGLEQQAGLAVADELNQQFRHVLREVNFTLPVFRFEVIGISPLARIVATLGPTSGRNL